MHHFPISAMLKYRKRKHLNPLAGLLSKTQQNEANFSLRACKGIKIRGGWKEKNVRVIRRRSPPRHYSTDLPDCVSLVVKTGRLPKSWTNVSVKNAKKSAITHKNNTHSQWAPCTCSWVLGGALGAGWPSTCTGLALADTCPAPWTEWAGPLFCSPACAYTPGTSANIHTSLPEVRNNLLRYRYFTWFFGGVFTFESRLSILCCFMIANIRRWMKNNFLWLDLI